ncbi:hypothetical protein [Daejeonella oryzae]|uniref:hypothetical protein n=1 Tax=Daejeonella oryzae TaxID=1122943 RepID=UPI0003FF0606|nr:hypothetical protein [Daejeonella oryzae]
MKKGVSILLLGFFLFNIIGYKLFFYYQIAVADSRMQSKIETMHETDRSLFTIKIPIRLPYHTDWKDFESIEGEMTYKNTTYKYVKRKVLRDTLILLCVNHQEKSLIQKNSDDYFKKVNDLNTDKSKQVLKQSKDDFFEKSVKLSFPDYPIILFDHSLFSRVLKTSTYKSSIEMPPDHLS